MGEMACEVRVLTQRTVQENLELHASLVVAQAVTQMLLHRLRVSGHQPAYPLKRVMAEGLMCPSVEFHAFLVVRDPIRVYHSHILH